MKVSNKVKIVQVYLNMWDVSENTVVLGSLRMLSTEKANSKLRRDIISYQKAFIHQDLGKDLP